MKILAMLYVYYDNFKKRTTFNLGLSTDPDGEIYVFRICGPVYYSERTVHELNFFAFAKTMLCMKKEQARFLQCCESGSGI
jgi:hypothetical protein